MFTQTCKKCGKVVEYETQEELAAHFYQKNGYYRKVCKDCEKKEHAEKYATGAYNYYRKKQGGYDKSVSFGEIGE
jgi:hypothetical protein